MGGLITRNRGEHIEFVDHVSGDVMATIFRADDGWAWNAVDMQSGRGLTSPCEALCAAGFALEKYEWPITELRDFRL